MDRVHPVRIPRHACSPRDRGRAGDLWRLVQEVAVADSAARGWPPERYRAIGTGFVVREILGVHARESAYGEELAGTTWIREARRGVLMRRETRLGDVLAATAEWVHVGAPPGQSLDEAMAAGTIGPVRASPELDAAFPAVGGETIRFPAWREVDRVELGTTSFTPWWTEMDPMGHTNHPRYVDWADEAVSRWLAGRGADPIGLVPLAERVRYRAGARAGEVVAAALCYVGEVEASPAGPAAVYAVRMTRGDELVADALIARAHLAGMGPMRP